MSAIGDLKFLVMKGFLQTNVLIKMQDPGNPTATPPVPAAEKVFNFLLRTPTMLEEAIALDKAGLDALPTKEGVDGKLEVNLSSSQFSKYIYGMLCVVIKEVNSEPVTIEEAEDFLKTATGDILAPLWDAFNKLNVKTVDAGTELKKA